MKLKLGSAVAVAALLALSGGVSADSAKQPSAGFDLKPLPYYVDETALPFQALPGATTSWGMTARGSGYRIEFPDKWNGDLVLALRGGGGICNAETKDGCKISSAMTPGNRARLIEEGYAWAAPTYRDNRTALATHVQDGLDVIDIFRKQHPNAPKGKGRVFVMGNSMGGNTTAAAIELFPKVFAGAMPGCFADTSFQNTYYYNLNLVATAMTSPDSPEIAAYFKNFKMAPDWEESKRLAPQIAAALGPNFPAERNAKGDKYREIIMKLTGGERPLFDAGFNKSIGPMVTQNVGMFTSVDSGNRSIIDNTKSDYGADLNKTIPRFTCDPEACTTKPITQDQADHLGGHYYLSGKISIPVLALHTTGEMVVPLAAGQDYANRVQKAGRSNLLVQRAYREINHCGFNAAEVGEAFDDLVKWVDTGKKPEGDNIRDAKLVAQPNFGCKFTRGAHKDDPDYAQICGK